MDSEATTAPGDSHPAPQPTPPTPQANPAKKNSNRTLWMEGVIAVIVVGLILWGLLWLFYLRFHETTDDSYVNGNLINVNTVISGTPIAFFADNTDLVEEGQLLVLLDPTEYQVIFDLQQANLASAVLQVRQLLDKVKENITTIEMKKVQLERARFDYNNRKNLIASKAVSNEDYIHAQDDLNIAELDLQLSNKQLQTSLSAIGTTRLEDHPIVEVAKKNLIQAYYNLKHCAVYAPYTGYVAQRQVEVGQWVAPTTAMMAIVPIDYMWVDANFKETQLRYMRIGQPAKVTIDLYGSSVDFEGTVLGIASGSGSVFSLIPPQNATGNWIKIVQRLAVRIGLNPEKLKDYPLRLGLSAYVNVNLTNTDLPMLAPKPANTIVASTDVFQLDFAEINQLIDKIIKENNPG